MKHTKEGDPLYHCVLIRVFNVGNDGKTTKKFLAGPGKGYTFEAIEKMLELVAADLERRLPDHDYQIVQITPASFNFVWRGKRGAPASQEQAEA
jgi:hypothetical protein